MLHNMQMQNRLLLLLGLLALGTLSCDSSPTSSTNMESSTGSGVTLDGVFASGSSSTTTLRVLALSSLDDITVEVAGTDITTMVRSDGSFSLEGLPAGEFTLVFKDENGQVLGELSFSNVLQNQAIAVVVALVDNTVTLVEEERDGVVVSGQFENDDSEDGESEDVDSQDSDSEDGESEDGESEAN